MTEPVSSTLTVTTPTDQDIVVTRRFDAPRELVFQAWTDPEHVRQWWGPPGSTMLVCEADVRPGGSWRRVTMDAGGGEVPFKGVYQEVRPPERLVYTEIYDVEPYNAGEPARNVVTFGEEGGQTLVTVTTTFPNRQVRDYVLQNGLEARAAAEMDRLAELLATLA